MTKKREISAAEMGIIFSLEKRKSLAGKKGNFIRKVPRTGGNPSVKYTLLSFLTQEYGKTCRKFVNLCLESNYNLW